MHSDWITRRLSYGSPTLQFWWPSWKVLMKLRSGSRCSRWQQMCLSFPGDPWTHSRGPTQNNISWNMFPLVHSRESHFPMSEVSIYVTNTSVETGLHKKTSIDYLSKTLGRKRHLIWRQIHSDERVNVKKGHWKLLKRCIEGIQKWLRKWLLWNINQILIF